MRFRPLLIAVAFLAALPQLADAQSISPDSTTLPAAIAKWEPEIAKLETRDAKEVAIKNGILFCGSSSFRRWDTIKQDMTPWPSMNRGYGGATLTDLNYYSDRLIGPHLGHENQRRCRAVVIFVANDISGNDRDPNADEVTQRFVRLLNFIRSKDATIPVFWLEVTPTEKRWQVWPNIESATSGIRQVLANDANAHFIGTAGAYLGPDGKPIASLFVADKLHLNATGYNVWAKLIKAKLHECLGAAIDPAKESITNDLD